METSLTKASSSDRLHMRITPDYKRLVSRAAALRGKSVAEFTRSAAVEKAQQVLQSDEIILLTGEHARAFYEVLSGDDAPTDTAIEAAKSYKAANIISR